VTRHTERQRRRIEQPRPSPSPAPRLPRDPRLQLERRDAMGVPAAFLYEKPVTRSPSSTAWCRRCRPRDALRSTAAGDWRTFVDAEVVARRAAHRVLEVGDGGRGALAPPPLERVLRGGRVVLIFTPRRASARGDNRRRQRSAQRRDGARRRRGGGREGDARPSSWHPACTPSHQEVDDEPGRRGRLRANRGRAERFCAAERARGRIRPHPRSCPPARSHSIAPEALENDPGRHGTHGSRPQAEGSGSTRDRRRRGGRGRHADGGRRDQRAVRSIPAVRSSMEGTARRQRCREAPRMCPRRRACTTTNPAEPAKLPAAGVAEHCARGLEKKPGRQGRQGAVTRQAEDGAPRRRKVVVVRRMVVVVTALQTGTAPCLPCLRASSRVPRRNALRRLPRGQLRGLAGRRCARSARGHIAALPGSAACVPCPPLTTAPPDRAPARWSRRPHQRDDHDHHDAADRVCSRILQPDGLEPCVPCLPGSFSSASGAMLCDLCPAGSFAGAAGSASCTLCGANTFSPAAVRSHACPARRVRRHLLVRRCARRVPRRRRASPSRPPPRRRRAPSRAVRTVAGDGVVASRRRAPRP